MLKLAEFTYSQDKTSLSIPWTTVVGFVVFGPVVASLLRAAPARKAVVTQLHNANDAVNKKASEESPKAE